MLFSNKNIIEKNDIKYIDETGIVENVYIVSAAYKTTENGKHLIEIKFKKGGAELIDTEWEPTKFGDSSNEDLKIACNKKVSRLIDILSCFYDRKDLEVDEDTFEGVARWFCKKIDFADTQRVPLRIKATYNKSNYIVLSPSAKYTFIEPMSIKKEDSKIRILTNDVIVRPKIDKDDINEIKNETYSSFGKEDFKNEEKSEDSYPF